MSFVRASGRGEAFRGFGRLGRSMDRESTRWMSGRASALLHRAASRPSPPPPLQVILTYVRPVQTDRIRAGQRGGGGEVKKADADWVLDQYNSDDSAMRRRPDRDGVMAAINADSDRKQACTQFDYIHTRTRWVEWARAQLSRAVWCVCVCGVSSSFPQPASHPLDDDGGTVGGSVPPSGAASDPSGHWSPTRVGEGVASISAVVFSSNFIWRHWRLKNASYWSSSSSSRCAAAFRSRSVVTFTPPYVNLYTW